jgi:hypothetical protein
MKSGIILLDRQILVSDVLEPDFAAFADVERDRTVPIHLVRCHACLASPVVHEGAQDIGITQQFDLVPLSLADACSGRVIGIVTPGGALGSVGKRTGCAGAEGSGGGGANRICPPAARSSFCSTCFPLRSSVSE